MQICCRVYDSYPRAEQAIRALEAAGVSSRDISLVAKRDMTPEVDISSRSTRSTTAKAVASANEAAVPLAALGLILVPGVGPSVVTGWLATAAPGTAGSAQVGSVADALVEAGVGEVEAQTSMELVRGGGTLVAVRSDLPNVEAIMSRSGPIDKAVEPLSRRTERPGSGTRQSADVRRL